MAQVSIVVPAYNCRDFIEQTVEAGLCFLTAKGNGSELIVVDDGSTDGTSALLAKLATRHHGLKVVSDGRNHGKGHAVRLGVLQSSGDRVVFIDADLAYPMTEVDKILAALDDGADVAVATRAAAESQYVMSPVFFNYIYTRHLGSRFFNRMVRAVLGLTTYDCQAGLKGFKREAAQILFKRQTLEGFTFDVELLFVAKRHRLSVREVPVVFRYFSEPTTVSFIVDSMKALRDVAKLRLNGWRGLYN